MSPLPCSPVSNSTASESQSFPNTSEDDSDYVSLTTPRPGPADPAHRNDEALSTPSVPAFSSSPKSVVPALASGQQSDTTVQLPEHTIETAIVAGASTPTSPDAAPTSIIAQGTAVPERQRSVTFLRQGSSPKRRSIYGGSVPSMSRPSPAVSPHAEGRIPTHEEEDDHVVTAESSADESTAIFKRDNARARQYGTEEGSSARRRVSAKGKEAQKPAGTAAQEEDKDARAETWWRRMVDRYGSVELENKGSVARDHLALERTFLAWLRTSLSFASIGIAVTQLFRLNTSLSDESGNGKDPAASLRQVGKPLGATFLGISILILLLGFHRYFESQHYVIRGKFPASRGTVMLVSFVAGGLIVASLAVVLAVAPTAFES